MIVRINLEWYLMQWDDALTHLNRVLASLYADTVQARRIAQMAHVPISQISFNGRPIDNWYAVLVEAETYGKTLAVAEAALQEYPTRIDLANATEAIRQRAPVLLPVPRQFTHQDKIRIRDQIITYFTLNDLRTLCQNMDIDYESINGGENKADKARELVAYCHRRMKVSQLVTACRNLFPDVSW